MSPHVWCNETQADCEMAPLLLCIVKLNLAIKKRLWLNPTVVNNLPQNVVSLSISLRQLDKTMFQGLGENIVSNATSLFLPRLVVMDVYVSRLLARSQEVQITLPKVQFKKTILVLFTIYKASFSTPGIFSPLYYFCISIFFLARWVYRRCSFC